MKDGFKDSTLELAMVLLSVSEHLFFSLDWNNFTCKPAPTVNIEGIKCSDFITSFEFNNDLISIFPFGSTTLGILREVYEYSLFP